MAKRLTHMIGLGPGSFKSPCGEDRADGEVKRVTDPNKVTCVKCLSVMCCPCCGKVPDQDNDCECN